MTLRTGLIVLDTLRYDTFVSEMSDVHQSAAHQYERMYSTARWTPPAHASLFTGLYPTEVGVHVGQQHLTTPRPVLAEQLSDQGMETVGLSNNINIDSFFDFDRGFDQFYRGPGLKGRPATNVEGFDWKELEKKISDEGLRRPLEAAYHIVTGPGETLPVLRAGLEMFLASGESRKDIGWAVDILDDLSPVPDDLFLFANLMTTHYPYDPPEKYSPCEPLFVNPLELALREEPATEEEHRRHIENYRGGARYLQDALPELIGRVDWDLLFVVSDHGELFGEYDIRGHQYGVYEELVHVPAVAFGTIVEQGTTSELTSLLDVHRTLLEAADIDADDSHRGVNLLGEELDSERTVYAESEGCEWFSEDATGVEARIPRSWNEPHYMVRGEEAMYICDKDGTHTLDPDTGESLLEWQPELSEAARRIRQGRGDYAGDQEHDAVPEDIQSQLEHLGYR